MVKNHHKLMQHVSQRHIRGGALVGVEDKVANAFCSSAVQENILQCGEVAVLASITFSGLC